MLLAIDIGNSNIKFGVFEGETLLRKFSIPTVRTQTTAEIASLTDPNLYETISAVVVSSVVPELDNSIKEFSLNHLTISPVFVSRETDVGLKINYDPPENLGVDRMVAAFAATKKYSAPCIVCNFGTATTIDAVSSNNEFLGGVIVAGMNLLADALFQKTSKLPKVEIKKARNVIGKSTHEAINAGIYFGYIGLADGIIKRMIGESGEKSKVIATGGLGSLIFEDSEFIDIFDENLMLDGLRLIYEKIGGKPKS